MCMLMRWKHSGSVEANRPRKGREKSREGRLEVWDNFCETYNCVAVLFCTERRQQNVGVREE